MPVNKDAVRILREKSGCGIMECKQALVEAESDIEKAQEILRKKGVAQAIKKGTRTTKDGLVEIVVNGNGSTGIIVEVDCETDFVAKTDDFKKLVRNITEKLDAEEKLSNVEKIPESIKSMVVDAIGKLKENIKISRFERFDVDPQEGLITSYIHPGSKLGVLVEIKCGKEEVRGHGDFLGFMKDLTMQVAAMNPSWVNNEGIPEEVISKEKEIYKQQAKDSGKPEKILDQIATGKLKKFYSQVCLLDQEFIKDSKLTVKKVIESLNASLGADIDVKRFSRFKVGEE